MEKASQLKLTTHAERRVLGSQIHKNLVFITARKQAITVLSQRIQSTQSFFGSSHNSTKTRARKLKSSRVEQRDRSRALTGRGAWMARRSAAAHARSVSGLCARQKRLAAPTCNTTQWTHHKCTHPEKQISNIFFVCMSTHSTPPVGSI